MSRNIILSSSDKLNLHYYFKGCFYAGESMSEAILSFHECMGLQLPLKQVEAVCAYSYGLLQKQVEQREADLVEVKDDIAVVTDLASRLPNILERLRRLER